ncbi:uncharacterized protein SOCE836_000560 [Sorangium cellulosum]|uniref:HEAT repeat domain-containing protein n=1 Tax=Sorangium cellulosum TaxID=56 RepID=A0A4P2QEZ0_SORCE|nr:uncharacterized protein SOCE836_000560 [Sorangium cellulosum]WCQ87393.1 hypothetical protein NQZ70_00056 [Sorangium sp. Soce836]
MLSLALGRIGEDDFLRQFPLPAEEKLSLGWRVLQFALSERESDAVEVGVILGDYYGMGREYVDVLERLAGEDWHRKHEDIVFALGRLASPTSVDAIYAAARSHHRYLEDYDDSFELRSKAIHALRNIGTPEAVSKLEQLFGELKEPSLRSKIIRRFQELASEGAPEEVRTAAQAALSRVDVADSEGQA